MEIFAELKRTIEEIPKKVVEEVRRQKEAPSLKRQREEFERETERQSRIFSGERAAIERDKEWQKKKSDALDQQIEEFKQELLDFEQRKKRLKKREKEYERLERCLESKLSKNGLTRADVDAGVVEEIDEEIEDSSEEKVLVNDSHEKVLVIDSQPAELNEDNDDIFSLMD